MNHKFDVYENIKIKAWHTFVEWPMPTEIKENLVSTFSKREKVTC
jgi:hypothetical protein